MMTVNKARRTAGWFASSTSSALQPRGRTWSRSWITRRSGQGAPGQSARASKCVQYLLATSDFRDTVAAGDTKFYSSKQDHTLGIVERFVLRTEARRDPRVLRQPELQTCGPAADVLVHHEPAWIVFG